ncbi:MAG: [Fe-S]-binding protein [Gammaproteobacteria bacterium RBG_16_66_13]|nr:MAG: [Fe-S]-binding protein [Gammaproteobacteria bacterium RBG_16_66_13]
MLSVLEKILFLLAALLSLYLTALAAVRIARTIARGQGRIAWNAIPGRVVGVLLKTISFAPTFRTRLVTSLFHAFVGWGFTYYLLVNIGDVVEGYIPGFRFMGEGRLGDLYRLGADILSGSVLVGMAYLIVRRFLVRPASLTTRDSTLLHPRARAGIRRDSSIVAAFIVLHVGGRFVGESFALASEGTDAWQLLASGVARLWAGWPQASLAVAEHVAWWFALGLILAFLPYFLYSKHIHLFFAPINFFLKPARRSIGELEPLNFDDPSIEQFGASRLEQLSWTALVDAYACIMCYRCQDACPAYATGKVLSPAALEINKRYFLNQEGARLARGEPTSQSLLDFAIPAEAVWACTACGACIDVCPVGNEPMRDILDIRRHLVLTESAFPEQLQAAFRGMERTSNIWNIGPEKRLEWAAGLDVPTVAAAKDFEILWWVGCAPATDARAQKTARAFVAVLKAAGVRYAVLGSEERCTGDSARRAGNEYLFDELATANVETLKRVGARRIVTTCPHCLHTLRTEYPAFGGDFDVIHHSQLIEELIEAGRLQRDGNLPAATTAFHDPCYLGRHNGIFEAPRTSLTSVGVNLTELPRSRAQSFCCGAGGAQMWKEEEHGTERVNANRIREVVASGAEVLAVGCPFCMIMLGDEVKQSGAGLEVRDIAEVIADRLGLDAG